MTTRHALTSTGARIPDEGALQRGGYRDAKARCGGLMRLPTARRSNVSMPAKKAAGRDRPGGFCNMLECSKRHTGWRAHREADGMESTQVYPP